MSALNILRFARATWRDGVAVACAFAALPIFALLLESLS